MRISLAGFSGVWGFGFGVQGSIKGNETPTSQLNPQPSSLKPYRIPKSLYTRAHTHTPKKQNQKTHKKESYTYMLYILYTYIYIYPKNQTLKAPNFTNPPPHPARAGCDAAGVAVGVLRWEVWARHLGRAMMLGLGGNLRFRVWGLGFGV